MLFLNTKASELPIPITSFFIDDWLNKKIQIQVTAIRLGIPSSSDYWKDYDQIENIRKGLVAQFVFENNVALMVDGKISGSSNLQNIIIPAGYQLESNVNNIDSPEGLWFLVLHQVDKFTPSATESIAALFGVILGSSFFSEELFSEICRFHFVLKDGKSHSFNEIQTHVLPFEKFSNNVFKKIASYTKKLEQGHPKRMKEALSWFSKSFKFQGHERFLIYFIALEMLTMKNEKDTNSLKEVIKITYQGCESIEDDFIPIGKMIGLRGRIVHHGFTPDLDLTFLFFCDLIFCDIFELLINNNKEYRSVFFVKTIYPDFNPKEYLDKLLKD